MHYCSYHKKDEPDENFRLKKNGKLDSWCKEGHNEYDRKYSKVKYAPIKEANAKRPVPTTKVCTGCKLEKPLEDFPERSDRPGKRHSRCESCFYIWKCGHNRASYQRTEGAIYASEKRALKAEITTGDAIATKEYSRILRQDPCSYCGECHEDMQIDHIDPIHPSSDDHGTHDWKNLTAACPHDNNSKNTKSLLFYLLEK